MAADRLFTDIRRVRTPSRIPGAHHTRRDGTPRQQPLTAFAPQHGAERTERSDVHRQLLILDDRDKSGLKQISSKRDDVRFDPVARDRIIACDVVHNFMERTWLLQ